MLKNTIVACIITSLVVTPTYAQKDVFTESVTAPISYYYLNPTVDGGINCANKCLYFANGVRASNKYVGIAAACPKRFLSRSKDFYWAATVELPDDKGKTAPHYYVCMDTGGAITGERGNPVLDILEVSSEQIRTNKWRNRDRATNKDKAYKVVFTKVFRVKK